MHISTTFFTALTLALVAPFVAGAAVPPANALDTRSDSTLAARGADEIIYITNCRRWSDAAGTYSASFAPWYSNWRNSQGGQGPDSLSNEYRDWSNGGGTITFEGREQVFSYQGGPTLYIHIQSDGLSVGFTRYAGYIDRNFNGGWSRFNCYRDNDKQLFKSFSQGGSASLDCYDKLYYCSPA